MTRFPHDQFAKDCLESLLSPLGQVQTSLNRRLGSVPTVVSTRIQQLTISQLDNLGEDLLDFTSLEDLESWLNQH